MRFCIGYKYVRFRIWVLLAVLCFGESALHAQVPDSLISDPAPVVYKSDTLFKVSYAVGAFSTTQRAKLIGQNIKELANQGRVQYDSLVLVDAFNGGVNIVWQDRVIKSVTLEDAAIEGVSTRALADAQRTIIRNVLVAEYDSRTAFSIAKDFVIFALLLGLLLLLWKGINRIFDKLRIILRAKLKAFVDEYSKGEHGRVFRLIDPRSQASFLLWLLRGLRIFVLLFLLYLYLPFLFSQLEYTRGFGEQLLNYVTDPLKLLAKNAVAFIPQLLFIIIFGYVGYQGIRLVGWLADRVKTGQIKVEGFYPDWANPTANLIRALIVMFTLIIIFPYLPGSNSDAFKGVSVFVGLLLSLGGAAAIGNVISGVILTYMRPFTVGDRVKLNDTVGDVMSKNLLVTRIRTTKNEEITIPNAHLLNGGIINYTSLSGNPGLVLHTSVTIGYDVPWPQVHELLLGAVSKVEAIQLSPKPFILQKALQDWYVEYELNAYTKDSHAMPRTYSAHHAEIQTAFCGANVEIMSPHYMAIRKGDERTVPPIQ